MQLNPNLARVNTTIVIPKVLVASLLGMTNGDVIGNGAKGDVIPRPPKGVRNLVP